jgi:hypothetical protein
MFFRNQYFKDFDYLYIKAKEFEVFHNQHYHYSTLKDVIPNQRSSRGIKLLSVSFGLPKKLIIVPGCIHLIRFISSDRIFRYL